MHPLSQSIKMYLLIIENFCMMVLGMTLYMTLSKTLGPLTIYELGIMVAISASILTLILIFLPLRTNSSHGNFVRPNPQGTNAPVVARTSTTNSNQHHNGKNFRPWLQFFILVVEAISLSLIAFPIWPCLAYWGLKSILRLAIDNIRLLQLAFIVSLIMCYFMLWAIEISLRNGKIAAAPVEKKAEPEFSIKAPKLYEKADVKTTAPVEKKAEPESLTEAQELREKIHQLLVAANASKAAAAPVNNTAEQEFREKVQEVREKLFRLAVASDAKLKDNCTESLLLSPSVFTGVMDVLLCKDTDSWWEIEPELAEYLRNVEKDEDEWELV